MVRRAVLWFRNDLRLKDNQLFHYPQVISANEVVAVYCLDPRHFSASPWGDHSRFGPIRGRFLAESLEELGHNLQTIEIALMIIAAKPEEAIPMLLKEGDVLAYQGEDTSEEQDVEIAVCTGLPASVSTFTHYGQTLYHREDLGFNVKETLPIPFGKFKFGICDNIQVRNELPIPTRGNLPKSQNIDLSSGVGLVSHDAKTIIEVMKCGDPPSIGDSEQGPVINWQGGEKAALKRMEEYMKPAGLGTYHRTRNQIQGESNSSKFSPWMANGCLSPRTVYWAAKKFEQSQDKRSKTDNFDHVYKFVFELNWRDYFRFYCAHFGKLVFSVGGPAKRQHHWRRDAGAEFQWKTGNTGAPLVDALMRELTATGYIANRGRYVVACYLVHYLGIDWRVGADWFERHLLDHDVCSNYGEWASMANVAAAPTRGQPLGLKGRGPTKSPNTGSNGSAGDPWKQGADIGFAIFDPWEQGKQYDKAESYVKRWLPQLRLVPTGFVHKPHMLSESDRLRAGCSDYPAPLALEPFMYPTATRKMSSGVQSQVSRDVKVLGHANIQHMQNGDARDSSDCRQTKHARRGGDVFAKNRWQEGYRYNNDQNVARKTNGRRWQAKASSTRTVYIED
jgi:deoxyribodipyrimidine photo-lyase